MRKIRWTVSAVEDESRGSTMFAEAIYGSGDTPTEALAALRTTLEQRELESKKLIEMAEGQMR